MDFKSTFLVAVEVVTLYPSVLFGRYLCERTHDTVMDVAVPHGQKNLAVRVVDCQLKTVALNTVDLHVPECLVQLLFLSLSGVVEVVPVDFPLTTGADIIWGCTLNVVVNNLHWF